MSDTRNNTSPPQPVIRWYLMPFTLLWGMVLSIRHFLYDHKILKSVSFDLPLFCVGNLSAGGSGKTPFSAYLLQFFQEKEIAVGLISRGYGRSAAGFAEVQTQSTAAEVGDEPLLLKQRFPQVPVGVGAKRIFTLIELLAEYPDVETIVLDDAFQHRAIAPSFNILLSSYHRLYCYDQLLPAGYLRDIKKAARRADVVIVSKCPENLSEAVQQKLHTDLNILPQQKLFFTRLQYEKPYFISQKTCTIDKNTPMVLVCGIAEPVSLVEYAQAHFKKIIIRQYPDHYRYTEKDWQSWRDLYFKGEKAQDTVLLTTEKDAVKILPLLQAQPFDEAKVAVLSIKTVFLHSEAIFQQILLQHIKAVSKKD